MLTCRSSRRTDRRRGNEVALFSASGYAASSSIEGGPGDDGPYQERAASNEISRYRSRAVTTALVPCRWRTRGLTQAGRRARPVPIRNTSAAPEFPECSLFAAALSTSGG